MIALDREFVETWSNEKRYHSSQKLNLTKRKINGTFSTDIIKTTTAMMMITLMREQDCLTSARTHFNTRNLWSILLR
ncbi:Hypothetical predicted protein [Octopus vulgaris]|uniref:Uncharacterized protein n=1 Tax=Octopus vulgaris TaxID=6645 RepID=A0AA36B821_OCTVU|nr:Hypothetical predicted protein [Octopus vulgaris]